MHSVSPVENEMKQQRWARVRACGCVTSSHEQSWCQEGLAQAQRSALFAGQYDGWREKRRWLGSVIERIRLLNPDYTGDDPVGLRFAQIELD